MERMEPPMKPWHIKEKRWLRPGEICLEGEFDFRPYFVDKEESQ
jgi:hypothetical protein